MITSTHLLVGAAIGKATGTFLFPEQNQMMVAGVSMILSILPDINILWNTKIKSHHDDVTHYPICWTIFGLLLTLLNISAGIFFLLITLSHFVLDTFGWTIGIKWFAPFNYHEFSFCRLEKDKLDLTASERREYLISHPFKLAIDAIVSLIAAVYLVI